MKIRTTGAIAAIVILAAAACQQDPDRQEPDGDASPPASAVRDSAGILITENARPADGSRLAWRMGSEPTVTIGAVEGEEPYLLHWIRNAFRLSDGRIVVANGGTDEVRVFTATGVHLASWGGKGPGPAEFGSLYRAEPWPGDSIVAWYSGNYGISFFDAGGNLGHSFVLRGDMEQRWMRPSPVTVRRDGSILSVLDETDRASKLVEIWDGEGRLRGSLGSRPNHEVITARGPGGHTEPVPAAYSRELVTAAWGDLVVASPNKPYEIRAFRADGTLARIVRRDHLPVTPTEADRLVFVEERKAVYRTGVDATTGARTSEAFLEQTIWPFLESFTLAEHFPAYSTVLADGVGHLWVREYDLPREEDPVPLWTVFDPEGRVLGFVETPAGLDILQIGEDFILGRVRDEFEVEYVQVWPLQRPEGQ